MDDLSQWRQNNDDYLAKSLAWLRLRLAKLAHQNGRAESLGSPWVRPATQAEPQSSGWWFWGRASESDGSVKPALLPPAPVNVTGIGNVSDEEIAVAAAEMSAAEAVDPPPEQPAVCQWRDGRRIDQHVVVLVAGLAQQDLQARRRQQLVRPHLWNPGRNDREVQILEAAHDLRQLAPVVGDRLGQARRSRCQPRRAGFALREL